MRHCTLALAALLATACASEPERFRVDKVVEVGDPAGGCLATPEVYAYFRAIQARVRERWSPPQGSGQPVMLTVVLRESGELASAEVAGRPDAVAESGLAALRAAAPFPAMEAPVRCIAGQTLLLRLVPN